MQKQFTISQTYELFTEQNMFWIKCTSCSLSLVCACVGSILAKYNIALPFANSQILDWEWNSNYDVELNKQNEKKFGLFMLTRMS